MILRTQWVVPITRPPIENGAVVVEGDRIVFVGPFRDAPPNGPIHDLGDATILPGLVNAHCHLEFSPSPHPLPKGERGTVNFTGWVRRMASPDRISRPPTDSINRLLHTGTTTVADHCNPETARFDTPFRRIIFWEVLGAAKDRAEASLRRAIERASTEGGFVTPHSLYGVHREVLVEMVSVGANLRVRPSEGRHAGLPLQSIHFLESSDEDEFLRHGTGPLADYVRERGGEVSPSTSPLASLPPGTMLIHGNYLNNTETAALHGRGVFAIHCPGSHRFFGHRRFPLEGLKRAGVRIAIGTDSLASNENLSMLREMRLLKESYPELDETTILEMATIDGARTLGMEKEIGSIEVGKKADLVAVKGSVMGAEEVCFSMTDGKICLNP